MSKLPLHKESTSFRARQRATEEEQRRSRSTSPFAGTGFHPTANNGIESDDFDGDLAAGNAGTKGWSMNSLRAAFGELILRPGSVGNDALANPSAFGFGGNSTLNFNVTTAPYFKTFIDIPVPTGFTKALVHCTVNATANNNTASDDFLYVQAQILLPDNRGGFGGEAFASVPAGRWGNAAASAAGNYEDVPPGYIILMCNVRAGSTWATNASNIANVDGTVTFLR